MAASSQCYLRNYYFLPLNTRASIREKISFKLIPDKRKLGKSIDLTMEESSAARICAQASRLRCVHSIGKFNLGVKRRGVHS